MQRTFNPLNRERYPGGPPALEGRRSNAEGLVAARCFLHSSFVILHFLLPGRLIAGHRPLKASVVVRVHPRQPFQMESAECGMQNRGDRRLSFPSVLYSALRNPNSALKALGGEIESRLAYTQKSEGQNLPGRPSEEVTRLSGALNT